MNKKNTKFAYAINAPLIIYLACVLLGPIIWGIWMSFTNKTIGGDAVFIGLDNYITLLADEEYRRSIINTLVFTFFSIVGKCFFGILMALALNIKFRGRNIIYGTIVAMLLIPIQAYMIPLYLLCSKIGLLNTYAGIILPSVANVTSIFILTSFFKGLPTELEEAARIDGCGEFRIFLQIMLPLSKPALSTVTILTFIANWNSFLWPMICIRQDELKTLPVGIAQFMGSVNSNAQFQYGTSLAGCCMAVIPTLIVYLLLQKHFVEGIASSGIKG